MRVCSGLWGLFDPDVEAKVQAHSPEHLLGDIRQKGMLFWRLQVISFSSLE